MIKKGSIDLWRELLDWPYHSDTKMMSLWVHILLMAAFSDHDWKGNHICRGQVVTSLSELARMVGISVEEVRNRLDTLERTGEITRSRTNSETRKRTIITVCKYADYQGVKQGKKQGKEQGSEQPKGHTTEPNNTDSNKETPSIEGVKKDGENSPLSQRQKKFYDELVPHLDTHGGQYPKEMIRAFYDYWSEPNRSKTKMRCELERTWDLPRRLKTWASRMSMNGAKAPAAQQKTSKVEKMIQTLSDMGVDVNSQRTPLV